MLLVQLYATKLIFADMQLNISGNYSIQGVIIRFTRRALLSHKSNIYFQYNRTGEPYIIKYKYDGIVLLLLNFQIQESPWVETGTSDRLEIGTPLLILLHNLQNDPLPFMLRSHLKPLASMIDQMFEMSNMVRLLTSTTTTVLHF